MTKEIDHIGIAVNDLEGSIDLYCKYFNASVFHKENLEDQGIGIVFLKGFGILIELLYPLNKSNVVAKFIEKRGPGFHHLAYKVKDINAELAHLKAQGAQLIDEKPRKGSRDSLIAFVHPKSSNGLLVEICQYL